MSTELDAIAEDLSRHIWNDWERFVPRLKQLIDSGRIRRIERLKVLYSRSEEWYLEPESGDIYMYVGAGERPPWVWKKIDPFAEPEQAHNNLAVDGLRVIERGRMSETLAQSTLFMMGLMIKQGYVEQLLPISQDPGVHWYRERSTNSIYRLTQNTEANDFRWELIADQEAQIYFGDAPIN